MVKPEKFSCDLETRDEHPPRHHASRDHPVCCWPSEACYQVIKTYFLAIFNSGLCVFGYFNYVLVVFFW